MVIKTTRWTPDHCKHGRDKCIIDYRWQDDGNDAVDKEITFQRFERTCSDHQTMHDSIGPTRTWNAILEENQRKNKIWKAFVENDDDIGENIIAKDGTPTRTIRKDLSFEYVFGPIQADGFTRAIEVQFRSKSNNQIKVIRNKKLIGDKLTELGVDNNKVVIK